MRSNEFYKKLAQLESDGNDVAIVVSNLMRQKYSCDRDGFKQAIEDGSQAVDDLVNAYRPYQQSQTASYGDGPPVGIGKLINQAGVVGQIWPGEIAGFRNYPSPLASMLVLGSLGGLAGKATGKAIEFVGGSPVLSRNASLIGAGLGLIPGAAMIAANIHNNKPALTGDVLSLPSKKYSAERYKECSLIKVDTVQDYVWSDPALPPTLAAATSALVEGANRLSPRRNEMPFITPSDVGRMAVGLGSGYLSGLVVGKVLGGLFGVSDKSQQVLQRSGAAAGLLKSVVPLVYQGQ